MLLPASYVLIFLALVRANSYEAIERDHESNHHCSADAKEVWSYRGSNGPSYWGGDCQTGRQQSPIDIKVTEMNTELLPLKLVNYNESLTKAKMENNGHTIEVTPRDGIQRTISVNGETYNLAQFHFHWGSKRGKGSEHTDDGKSYDMEIHFVHVNNEQNSSRLAVVGVFVKEQAAARNDALQKITAELKEVMYKDEETELKLNLNLNDLLPANPTPIYRYDGSLTTPPCTEGVKWSVAVEPIVGQIKPFRNLYSVTRPEGMDPNNRDCKLSDNNRPIQETNGRKVLRSTDNEV